MHLHLLSIHHTTLWNSFVQHRITSTPDLYLTFGQQFLSKGVFYVFALTTIHVFIVNGFDNFPSPSTPSATLPATLQSIKFMDDATVQEAINLTTNLVPSNDGLTKILPKENTLLQTQLNRIKKVSDDREMSLNNDKTCLFIVNFTVNHQFQPHLSIPGSQNNLNVVSETKLLGYWLTENMKTNKHIQFILQISYKRMWAISKLAKAGISPKDVIHFFNVKIRSVLETNCPVFHSMMTKEQSDDIERLQKFLLRTLLRHRYTTYEEACILYIASKLRIC